MTTIDLRRVRTPGEAKRLMDRGLRTSRHIADLAFDVARPDGTVEHHVIPTCRWCGGAVIRNLPCHCDRGQEEARRIRAGA